jgi:Tfp pilus assembly protein PilX
MRGTSRRSGRAFVLPYVMGFAAVLAVIAMMLLQSANSASDSTYTIQDKNAVFDAAEAGLNAALDDLDISLLTGANRTSTLPNGYKFTYTIYPNFLGGLLKTITDPITGSGTIQLPIGGAIIDSTGYDPTGQRTSTVEAAVTVDTTQLTYPHYAVAAGLDIQGSYDPLGITDPGGGNAAAVHANGNITASVGGGVQGPATASGLVNSLPPGTTSSATVPLPTVSQFDFMVASYKSQAQVFAPTYVCSGLGTLLGCLLFYDGSLDQSTQGVTFSGPWTMVVNGDLEESGDSYIAFSTKPNMLIVNGNAHFTGRSYVDGYIQVKGSTDIGGEGLFSGAIMSLGSMTFSGGGESGGIVYDPSVIPPSHLLTGLVKILTYAEY